MVWRAHSGGRQMGLLLLCLRAASEAVDRGQQLQACNSSARLQSTGLSMASCKLPLLQNSRTIHVSRTFRSVSPGEVLSSGGSCMRGAKANCVGKAAQHLLCIAVSVTTTQATETVNELSTVWQLEAWCKAFGCGRKARRFAGRDYAVLWNCLQWCLDSPRGFWCEKCTCSKHADVSCTAAW